MHVHFLLQLCNCVHTLSVFYTLYRDLLTDYIAWNYWIQTKNQPLSAEPPTVNILVRTVVICVLVLKTAQNSHNINKKLTITQLKWDRSDKLFSPWKAV